MGIEASRHTLEGFHPKGLLGQQSVGGYRGEQQQGGTKGQQTPLFPGCCEFTGTVIAEYMQNGVCQDLGDNDPLMSDVRS